MTRSLSEKTTSARRFPSTSWRTTWGGGAKSLYSIDDGSAVTDLLIRDTDGWERTADGNSIRIVAGRIEFRLGGFGGWTEADVNGLAAGQYASDSFIYAIQLGSGTLSWATATLTVAGSNDLASIAGTSTGSLSEDDTSPATGTLSVSDVDDGEAHTLAGSGTSAKGSYTVDTDGYWTYTVDNAAAQHLAAGATDTDSFEVTSTDGTASQTVSITINGANDAAVLSSATVNLTEGNTAAAISTSGVLTISDVDSPASFVAQTTVGAYGTFSIDAAGAWSYAASSAHDEFTAGITYADPFTVQSADGTTTSVTVNILGTDEPAAPVVFPPVDLASIAAGTGGFVIYGQDPDDQSGMTVASAGDVNGDGFGDLIIGARYGDAAGNAKPAAGESYFVFGKAGGFGASIDLTDVAAGTGGFVIYGQDGGDQSGQNVASAGDINGDGFGDVIIGAFFGDAASNAKTDAGESYVVFGKAGGFSASSDLTSVAAGTGGFVIYGRDAGDWSSSSVASAGDINGDGFDDLIIGANGGDGAGNATSYAGESYVVFGKASGFGASIDLTNVAAGTGGFVIYGRDGGDEFGDRVASAGDINGDGFDDLFIGAFRSDGAGNSKANAGESYVVFGKASGFGASIDLTGVSAGTGGFVIYGQDAFDYSGNSVATAGDINGDGFGDLIIGAQGGDAAGNAKSFAGESYVVFGHAGGFGASIDLTDVAAGSGGFVIYGQDAGDRSGNHSVASAGDINGDGFDDLIVGSMYGDAAGNAKANAGESYVVFGKSAGFGASIDLTNVAAGTGGFVIYGQDAGDFSGYWVASAGDIDGDGFDDLIIDARFGDAAGNAKSDAGESYVLFGSDLTNSVTQLGTTAADTLTGTAAADDIVGGQGDDTLIGNGDADVLIGGSGDDILAVSDDGFFRLDGGSGVDTLRLDGSGMTFDLSTIANSRLQGIERIDLTGSGDNMLVLSVLEVLNLSDTSNQLIVTGNAGDGVAIGSGWTSAGPVVLVGVTYDSFASGAATLLIDQAVTHFP